MGDRRRVRVLVAALLLGASVMGADRYAHAQQPTQAAPPPESAPTEPPPGVGPPAPPPVGPAPAPVNPAPAAPAPGAPAPVPATPEPGAPAPASGAPAPVSPSAKPGAPTLPSAPAAAAPPPVSGAAAPGVAPLSNEALQSGPEDEQPKDETHFYAAGLLLGALYFHGATYEFETGVETSQLCAGLGYELVLLLGGGSKQFAIGGAVAYLHVPKTHVTYDGGSVPGTDLRASDIPEVQRSTWTTVFGPGIDYRPAKIFRVGGMVGIAIARVPKFDAASNQNDTMGGFGSSVWVGADWPVSAHTRFGFAVKGSLQSLVPRNLDVPAANQSNETSLSLSGGVGFSSL